MANVYEMMQPDYDFLSHAYYGEGGFKDGSYLISHPRETTEKYNKRKELAYYLNYVAAVVNSHVDPIFRTEAARDWGTSTDGKRKNKDANAIFSSFYKDCDTNGTKLPKFMKRAARIAKLHAVAFIVVDNVREQPGTMADALKERMFPYVYIVKPQQVTDYEVNKAGKLTSITYTTSSDKSKNGTPTTETWTWTEADWKVIGATGTEQTGLNPIKRVPVVPLFGRDRDPGEMKPQSEFYNIARANKRLYNLCSEIDELIRNQAFNILTYPMGEGQDTDNVKEIVGGTENVMGYDGTLSNSPDFIAPDSAPLEQLRQERKDLIQEIYRMAELSHVTGVEQKTSGVAKAWDFQNTNQVLSDFAGNCEHAELDVAILFEKWTNSKVDYEATYSDDFGIVDVAGALDEVGKALDLNIGGQFNKAVKKKAVDVYLNDLSEEEFDQVIEDIEARAQDETYDFNGSQVTSAVELLTAVAEEKISPSTAIAMLQAFFGVEADRAKEMVDGQVPLIGVVPKTVPNPLPAAGLGVGNGKV